MYVFSLKMSFHLDCVMFHSVQPFQLTTTVNSVAAFQMQVVSPIRTLNYFSHDARLIKLHAKFNMHECMLHCNVYTYYICIQIPSPFDAYNSSYKCTSRWNRCENQMNSSGSTEYSVPATCTYFDANSYLLLLFIVGWIYFPEKLLS